MDTGPKIEQALALASGCLARCWVLEILAIGLVADDSMSSYLKIEQVSLMGCLVGWLWQMKVLATGLGAAAQERLEGQEFGQLGWVVAALLGAHWLKDWPYLSIHMYAILRMQ